MVVGWFPWFFKVESLFFKVVSWIFHGFWLVSMVFHGSFMVFMVFHDLRFV